ncbi:MAG TPA: TlpA disulfide reductase family protein [Rudaea sp.]
MSARPIGSSGIVLRGIAAALFAAAVAVAAPVRAIDVGQSAPAFDLKRIGGDGSLRSSELKGKVVLVDFWASWCGPCRQSLPLYNKLRAEFPRTDFDIVAINLDEDLADAKTFLAQHPIDYVALGNPQGDVAKAFDLKGMPSSYLVDRDGVVRATHVGFDPKDIDGLRTQIAALTGKPAHAP